MARPKSEDKRNAILDAATRLFSERGLTAAPTSEISKLAGVAEGTLFTYFKTKDDLINALYREKRSFRTSGSMKPSAPELEERQARLRESQRLNLVHWREMLQAGVTLVSSCELQTEMGREIPWILGEQEGRGQQGNRYRPERRHNLHTTLFR